MNIGIVISNSEMGGAQRVTMHLAKWIADNTENCICVIALQDAKRESYDMTGTDYYSLHGVNIIRELKAFIKRKRLDVIVTMGVPLAVYTVPACIGTKVKHIISERNDPAHFSGKKSTKIASRLLMKLAQGFVFQTEGARDYYGRSIAKKSKIIPNPLVSFHEMEDPLYCDKRNKTIVSVGRLNKQKNQMLLLEAFSEIHKIDAEYKLIIWGEGPERESLENKIKELNLGLYISLPGTTDNIIKEIYDEGIFVLCSDFEGMPNALMEAMALGLPCISTDCPCGGPKELIDDGINGVLIPVNSISHLVEALTRLIEDKSFSIRIGKEAVKIRNKYSIESICRRWMSFINEVSSQ